TVQLDLEFLDCINDRKEGDLTGFRLQHRYAVKEILIGSRAASVDAREERCLRQGDSRSERNQRNKRAAVKRKIDDLSVIDHLAEASGFSPEQPGIGCHRYAFIDSARQHFDVETDSLAGCELQAFPHGAL